MNMEECLICVEPFTKEKRRSIKCEYCDFTACKACMTKWILEETKPKCMNNDCDREWTQKFLCETFGDTFVKTKLKIHRENVLFDKERALLPATQPLVENIIQGEEIQNQITAEYQKIRDTERNIFRLRRQRDRLLYGEVNQVERTKFIKACPSPECRGFLSSQWKCGICQNFTCPDCHEVKGPNRECDHVCDENAKATAMLLANDTKSCPNCGVGIYKIEGCDQMWCTECHTAFSWRTGRVENNIHNPHYYEWMRRNGGQMPLNHNEIQCGREIDHNVSRGIDMLLLSHQLLHPLRNIVRTCCRNIIHHRFTVLPNYQVDNVQNNQDLRVKYMRQQITEDEFKKLLQRSDKKYRKKREFYNIFVMFVNVSTEIIFRLYGELTLPDFPNYINEDKITELQIIVREIEQIINYSNTCFEDVAKTFHCASPEIRNWFVSRLSTVK